MEPGCSLLPDGVFGIGVWLVYVSSRGDKIVDITILGKIEITANKIIAIYLY